MYIHTRADLIYLAHPRTASQATRDALFELGFIQHNDHHSRLPSRMQTGDYSVATTVRNHFGALVSWWHATHRKYVLGPDYIDKLFTAEPTYFPVKNRMWAFHAPSAGTILRFESLLADLNSWLDAGGLPTVDEIPRVNVTDQKHGAPYTAFVPQPLVAYVRIHFREEMEEYGYDYNVPRVTKQ